LAVVEGPAPGAQPAGAQPAAEASGPHHTACHTGADLLMLGSGGGSNLKEKALGHVSVYGHDALEGYGPALLQAREAVLFPAKKDNKKAGAVPRPAPSRPCVSVPARTIGQYRLPRLTD
jgi:hypothetical protein